MSALFGGALWFLAPWVPLGAPPSFGSLDHTFLFMPLVSAPLALGLVSVMLGPGPPGSSTFFQRAALGSQPLAAALLLASFFLAKGELAFALSGGWFAVTLLFGLGGARRVMRARASGRVPTMNLFAAHLFLPVGAAWLLLSRLGVAPANLTSMQVFLATLHFHFSGFTLQILIAATRLLLRDRAPRLIALQRGVAVAAVAGIPIIAIGNIAGAPSVKFIGVSAMVGSTLVLAVTSAIGALGVPARVPRVLILVSSVSIAAAMSLAGVYGTGELLGRDWLGIPRMVASHGLLNALGFTLCGLLGHSCLRDRSPVATP